MKLSTRLRMSHMVAATVPVAAFVLLLFTYAQDRLREQTAAQLNALATIQAHRLEAFVDRAQAGAALIASRTQMRISLEAWLDDGEEWHHAKMHRILQDAVTSAEDIRYAVIYTLAGRPVVSAGASTLATDIDAAPVAAEALPTFVAVPAGPGNARPGARVRTAVMLDGQLLGTLLVEIDMTPANDIAGERHAFGEGSETLLVTGLGGGARYYVFPPRFGADAEALNAAKHTLIGLENEKLHERLDYRGVATWTVVRHVPEAGLLLAVKLDRDEAASLIDELSTATLLLLVAAILIALVLAFTTSQRRRRRSVRLLNSPTGWLPASARRAYRWVETTN